MTKVHASKIGPLLIIFALLFISFSAYAARLEVATGERGANYYNAGVAICSEVEKSGQNTCSSSVTTGSMFNIDALRIGAVDFAILQENVAYQAYKGTGPFDGMGSFPGLRLVSPLYTEQLIILTREDTGIRNFSDLKGKRVAAGGAGSGTRITVKDLIIASGMAPDDINMDAINFSEQAGALCSGEIAAVAFVVGHPSKAVQDTIRLCDAKAVILERGVIQAIANQQKSHYFATTINANTYSGLPENVYTLGVTADLFAVDRVSDSKVSDMISAVLDNPEIIKSKLSTLMKDFGYDYVLKNITLAEVPLHNGAASYFKALSDRRQSRKTKSSS